MRERRARAARIVRRVAAAPELLEPSDVSELPARRVDDGELRKAAALRRKVRVHRLRIMARIAATRARARARLLRDADNCVQSCRVHAAPVGRALVTPSLADANNGNWRTAVALGAHARAGLPGDCTSGFATGRRSRADARALIALHARRSHAAIAAWRARHPDRAAGRRADRDRPVQGPARWRPRPAASTSDSPIGSSCCRRMRRRICRPRCANARGSYTSRRARSRHGRTSAPIACTACWSRTFAPEKDPATVFAAWTLVAGGRMQPSPSSAPRSTRRSGARRATSRAPTRACNGQARARTPGRARRSSARTCCSCPRAWKAAPTWWSRPSPPALRCSAAACRATSACSATTIAATSTSATPPASRARVARWTATARSCTASSAVLRSAAPLFRRPRKRGAAPASSGLAGAA